MHRITALIAVRRWIGTIKAGDTMRKCRNCLCRTCKNVCCNRIVCPGKKKECKQYGGWRQVSIFDILNEPQEKEQEYKAAPRYPIEYYGLTEERVAELEKLIQSGRYASLVSQAAHTANEDIAEYLILSVVKNISYDTFQKKWQLGEMEQIPYCRTDFYGYRRYALHLFDLELRRIGK